MNDYATVYGRFYRGNVPVSGIAYFYPRTPYTWVNGSVYNLRSLVFSVDDGVLMSNGSEGVSIPAPSHGHIWDVLVLPMNYSTMLKLYSGDMISLGD